MIQFTVSLLIEYYSSRTVGRSNFALTTCISVDSLSIEFAQLVIPWSTNVKRIEISWRQIKLYFWNYFKHFCLHCCWSRRPLTMSSDYQVPRWPLRSMLDWSPAIRTPYSSRSHQQLRHQHRIPVGWFDEQACASAKDQCSLWSLAISLRLAAFPVTVTEFLQMLMSAVNMCDTCGAEKCSNEIHNLNIVYHIPHQYSKTNKQKLNKNNRTHCLSNSFFFARSAVQLFWCCFCSFLVPIFRSRNQERLTITYEHTCSLPCRFVFNSRPYTAMNVALKHAQLFLWLHLNIGIESLAHWNNAWHQIFEYLTWHQDLFVFLSFCRRNLSTKLETTNASHFMLTRGNFRESLAVCCTHKRQMLTEKY